MFFKNITYSDKDFLEKKLTLFNTKSYEYTFTTLYLWRNLYNTSFCILKDSLVLKKDFPDFFCFMMPTFKNINELKEIINSLKTFCIGHNQNLILCDIDEYNLSILKENFDISYNEIREVSEYIYLTKDLISLKGPNYHNKKRQYNFFNSNYEYNITTINNKVIALDCLKLIENSHLTKPFLNEELSIEIESISDIIYKLDDLDLKSIAIYVNNILVGFSIAEIYKDTAIIHIERCNKDCKGAYAFINKKFLSDFCSSTILVNRQEDCGDLNLRKSKLSYNPCYLLKKYRVVIN